MTEIRPIQKSESEAFLALMCDVFDLDFHRAHDVFYSEPMFDISRKWALFVASEMVSILTTTPLIFGWGRACGIAGVATRASRQGEGWASRLLQFVLENGENGMEPAAMLFARDCRLYERNGFEARDEVIRAEIAQTDEPEGRIIEGDDVEPVYDAWSAAHPDRLRRDKRRWAYWRWNFRVPTEFGDGYVCHEPDTIREALFTPPPGPLPVPPGTTWYGTRTMASQLQLSLLEPRAELTLMCRHAPGVPQLFMTDQF